MLYELYYNAVKGVAIIVHNGDTFAINCKRSDLDNTAFKEKIDECLNNGIDLLPGAETYAKKLIKDEHTVKL